MLNSESIRETRDLHILQAHLLYYRTLLDDFRKSVVFVQETANPAMQDSSVNDKERTDSETILKRETDYLLSEIERLESQRSMHVMRLKNVMDLVRSGSVTSFVFTNLCLFRLSRVSTSTIAST